MCFVRFDMRKSGLCGVSIRNHCHWAVFFIYVTLVNTALDECVVTIGPNIGSCQFPTQLVVTSQPTATLSAGLNKFLKKD